MARNAPAAPRMVAQMIKERKLSVAESPTVTPDDPRLDDRLDNEIEHAIDDDDDNRGHDILIEQSDDCRRHESDNESDIRECSW